MPQTILLLGTFDTKGAEYAYVRDLIIARGHQVLMMDAGVSEEPPFIPDIQAAQVAEAGGGGLGKLRGANDRGAALEVMTRGVAVLATRLYAEGKLDGVLSLGGSGGTSIATTAMRALPVGVPQGIKEGLIGFRPIKWLTFRVNRTDTPQR